MEAFMQPLKLSLAILSASYTLVGCQEDTKRKPASTPAPAEQPKTGGEDENKDKGGGEKETGNKAIGKLTMRVDTRFKTDTATDYTKVTESKPNEFCALTAGTSVEVMEVVSQEQKYVKVRLSGNPSTCNFAVGYFYKDHLTSATPQ